MKMLSIDTSTLVMGVSVFCMKEGKVLGEVVTNLLKNHSVRLMPTIERCLSDLELQPADLEAIAVTSGPGSYTGIRIGVTTAKTFSWVRGIPLYSESSLTVLAMNGFRFQGLVVPLFDARRERVYSGLYQRLGDRMIEVLPQQVVNIYSWLEQIKGYQTPVLFLGEDTSRFQSQICEYLGDKAVFGTAMENLPRPSQLSILAWNQWKEGQSSESIHFTPDYLQMTEAEANWLRRERNGETLDEQPGEKSK